MAMTRAYLNEDVVESHVTPVPRFDAVSVVPSVHTVPSVRSVVVPRWSPNVSVNVAQSSAIVVGSPNVKSAGHDAVVPGVSLASQVAVAVFVPFPGLVEPKLHT